MSFLSSSDKFASRWSFSIWQHPSGRTTNQNTKWWQRFCYRMAFNQGHYSTLRWRMGPLLVLVSRCLRENVLVTCKIGAFLCSLDNVLQKNVIVFFFGKFSKWRSFEKKGYILTFWPTFHIFLVTREKLQKFLLHISHYVHDCIFLTLLTFFCLTNFAKKNTSLSGMVSLWCDFWCWFLFAPFWNNQ